MAMSGIRAGLSIFLFPRMLDVGMAEVVSGECAVALRVL